MEPGPSPAPAPQRLQRGRHPQTPQLLGMPGTRRKRRRKRGKRKRRWRPTPEPCALCRRRRPELCGCCTAAAEGSDRHGACVRAGGMARLSFPFLSFLCLFFPSRRGKPGRRERLGPPCAHAGLSRGAGIVPPGCCFQPRLQKARSKTRATSARCLWRLP